jgi:hypothetical protein
MTLLTGVFRASEKAGRVLTCAGVMAWLGLCAWLLNSTPALLRLPGPLWLRIAWIKLAMLMALTLAALSGLVGWWLIASQILYQVRGHRLRRLGPQWCYEERAAGSTLRVLPLSIEFIGSAYPAERRMCRVGLLSAASWETQAPVWALGRRGEIMQRIARCLGSHVGASILFD